MEKFGKWIPAISVAIIIFGLSSLTGDTVKGAGLGKQTYQLNGHFVLYFVLFITLYKATKDIKKSLILCIFYSITDELHQIFVPGRSWQYRDLLVDTLGSSLGYLLIWKFYYLIPNKLKIWLEK